jgi:hypothetical protein
VSYRHLAVLPFLRDSPWLMALQEVAHTWGLAEGGEQVSGEEGEGNWLPHLT